MKLHGTSVLLLALAVAVCAPAGAITLYSNGPINGTINAWNTCCGFAVTDSFTISSNSTVTGFDGGFWLGSGDTPVQVDWAIGTSAFGNDKGSGTSALSNVFFETNGFGYDIYTSTASGLSVALGPGTYWLTLQNGITAQSSNLFWDENDGPSMAQQTFTGPIGSEAFNIYGTGSTTPEPGTIVMFASGVLGLGSVIRRKLML